jgi:hypothetical protein
MRRVELTMRLLPFYNPKLNTDPMKASPLSRYRSTGEPPTNIDRAVRGPISGTVPFGCVVTWQTELCCSRTAIRITDIHRGGENKRFVVPKILSPQQWSFVTWKD